MLLLLEAAQLLLRQFLSHSWALLHLQLGVACYWCTEINNLFHPLTPKNFCESQDVMVQISNPSTCEEAETGRSLGVWGQTDLKSQESQGYTKKPCLSGKKKPSWEEGFMVELRNGYLHPNIMAFTDIRSILNIWAHGCHSYWNYTSNKRLVPKMYEEFIKGKSRITLSKT